MNDRSLAVIAGGMGDIGRAIATRLATDGFRVAVLAHSSKDAEIQSFVDSLEGSDHYWERCDLSQASEIQSVIQRIAEKGKISVCIHAASPKIHRVGIQEETAEELAKQMDVQVYGALALFQAAAKQMSTGGRIVAITSAGVDPALRAKRMGGYLVAKSAFAGMLREFAKELAPQGITVNAVAPSFVATALNADLPERLAEFVKEGSPMKVAITPQDVAGAVSFLCSDDARTITGVTIPVSGGESMTM